MGAYEQLYIHFQDAKNKWRPILSQLVEQLSVLEFENTLFQDSTPFYFRSCDQFRARTWSAGRKL